MGPKTLPDLDVIDRHEFRFGCAVRPVPLFEFASSGPDLNQASLKLIPTPAGIELFMDWEE
jgi:hypothetical protein